MTTPKRPLILLPTELSDESAAQLFDILSQITLALEHHYADQILRYHHPPDDRQPDLWHDQDPPF
jgi:hypothetical protein